MEVQGFASCLCGRGVLYRRLQEARPSAFGIPHRLPCVMTFWVEIVDSNGKMATIVQEFGLSSEKTEFSGSSVEDVAYAKSFWQSVQLLPPMESRLVSSTIRQRLRTASSSSQRKNSVYWLLSTLMSLSSQLLKSRIKLNVRLKNSLRPKNKQSLTKEETMRIECGLHVKSVHCTVRPPAVPGSVHVRCRPTVLYL